MNFFAYPAVAERYANGRPFFHPLAIGRIRKICCETNHIDLALDVGCGTGQSTLALLEIADEIIGLDSSPEMLAHTASHERMRFVQSQAEQMPFDDASFGLITVGLAIHWFDQEQFMREARRVLRPGGWMVIYNDSFSGRMAGNESYEIWNRQRYLPRFPTPPRNSQTFSEATAFAYGFGHSRYEQFAHEVRFTQEQLVNYLLTQTNVISVVEAGKEDLQSVTDWLLKSVQPMFARSAQTFQFSCQMQFLQRG